MAMGVVVSGVLSACGADTPPKDDSLPLPARPLPPDDAGGAGTPDAAIDPPPLRDSGLADAADGGAVGCNGAPNCERVVFVTNASFVGGAVGGLVGADAKCQAAAAASTVNRIKGRSFVAWISGTGAPASARLVHGAMNYVQADGKIIANDWADLTDGSLDNGIDRDEANANTNGSAWTGTTLDGSTAGANCGDWIATQQLGRRGNVGGSGNGWSDSTAAACTASHHLYCFER